MPTGCIIMFNTGIGSGFIVDGAGFYIAFGLEIWRLCDGTIATTVPLGSAFGATPNLINKFARGIDTITVPALLPEAITISNTPLTVAEIPQMTASGTTTAPPALSTEHLHDSTGGFQGFAMWDSTGTQGAELIPPPTGNTVNAPLSAVQTAGVSGIGNSLSTHTHNFSANIGSAVPVAPLSGGTGIKPTSFDVLYICRVF